MFQWFSAHHRRGVDCAGDGRSVDERDQLAQLALRKS
jgi:hypothetical protein